MPVGELHPGPGDGSAPSGNGRTRSAPDPTGLPGYGRDPWEHAPTEELQDQVLPRWFVLLAIVAVLAAVGTFVAAFWVFGLSEVPLAERRPPPADPVDPRLTHDVGMLEAGGTGGEVYADACPALEGVRVAGTAADQASLRRGLAAACNAADDEVADALSAFADAGGVVRFAAFEQTGIASTATVGGDPPQIYVNARFSRSDPLQIAPLIVHDVIARTDPGDAATELAARTAEAGVCTTLFSELPPSCSDAVDLVELPSALAALREAGYR